MTARLGVPAALLGSALLVAGCGGPPAGIPPVDAVDVAAEPGWDPPVAMARWEYIVIHHSATRGGNAGKFHKHHRRKGWDGLGYHFVIGNGTDSGDGQVEVGYRWLRQSVGAHVGGRNNIGKIGLCLVGDFQNGRATTRQMNSLNRLLEFLQVRCGIPASRVRGHCEVCRPGYTLCPGRHFSMSALRAGLMRQPPSCRTATFSVHR